MSEVRRDTVESPKHDYRVPPLVRAVSAGVKRVESTPDPNTSEKYRDTPPISIAILLQKYALLSAESTNIHHQFVSRCASHLYRDTFAEVLGQGSLGHPQE